jgi:hypothetical protein
MLIGRRSMSSALAYSSARSACASALPWRQNSITANWSTMR